MVEKWHASIPNTLSFAVTLGLIGLGNGLTVTPCAPVAIPAAARVAVSVAERYVLFAAQSSFDDPVAGAVQILDVSTATWTTTNMSSGRTNVATTSWGPLAIFAGGTLKRGLPKSDAVDVWNATDGSWSHYHMSIGRDLLAAASCGDYTIFAGGSAPGINQSETAEVDVWHHPTNVWTKAKLSQPRKKPEAVCAGGKIVVAGGEIAKAPPPPPPRRLRDYTATVDIFDTDSGEWSTSQLGQARQYFGAARATPDTAIFAGGFYNDIRLGSVEIYNASSDSWNHDAALLSHNRSNLDGCNAMDRYAAFGSGNIDSVAKVSLDFYDGALKEWANATSPLSGNPTTAAVKNLVLFSYFNGTVLGYSLNSHLHGELCPTTTRLDSTARLVVGNESSHFLCDGENRPDGCFRRSDVTMRSETPHFFRQPAASRMAKDQGDGRGLYTTAEAATAFSVNRIDWVYSNNASWVKQSLSHGIRAISLTINGNLPDVGSDPASYKIGRAKTVDGSLLAAPWMRTWNPVPYRGCVNNPDYVAIVNATVKQIAAANPTALQHDDWSTNEGSVAFAGGNPHASGCYCEHCMAGFTTALISGAMNKSMRAQYNVTMDFDYREYLLDSARSSGDKNATLRELFVSFQQNSTQKYFRGLRNLLGSLRPGGIPLGCNNGGKWSATTELSCDYGMGELSKRDTSPPGLETIFRDGVPSGRQQVMTMPKEGTISACDVQLTRSAISTAYALGGNMLVPWDVYLPQPSAPRYWGSASDFGDLYAFVSAYAHLFDSANVSLPNELPANMSFELVHTGADGDKARFNLPSDTTHPAAGRCLSTASVASCEYSCLIDRKCVAIFSDAPHACCTLYEPLKVITGTSLLGDSYIRRNCSFSPSGCGDQLPNFACNNCTNISIYARRGDFSPSEPFITLHVVNFATCQTLPSKNITIRIQNSALFGGDCGSFKLTSLSPNRTTVTLTPTCLDVNSSTVSIPTPEPWTVLLATPR